MFLSSFVWYIPEITQKSVHELEVHRAQSRCHFFHTALSGLPGRRHAVRKFENYTVLWIKNLNAVFLITVYKNMISIFRGEEKKIHKCNEQQQKLLSPVHVALCAHCARTARARRSAMTQHYVTLFYLRWIDWLIWLSIRSLLDWLKTH